MANKKGMPAKRRWDGLLTFVIAATPATAITAPAVKLAPAEKHIIISFLYFENVKLRIFFE
jgi:hypothetical protein